MVVLRPENGLSAFGHLTISVAPMTHSAQAQGVRIQDEEGTVMSYSGDTDYCPEIAMLGRHADILVLECSFPGTMKVRGHLVPRECGRIAREAEAKHLIVTHLYPPCREEELRRECAKEYGGPVTVARDFMEITAQKGQVCFFSDSADERKKALS